MNEQYAQSGSCEDLNALSISSSTWGFYYLNDRLQTNSRGWRRKERRGGVKGERRMEGEDEKQDGKRVELI